jgi:hypothetical protein
LSSKLSFVSAKQVGNSELNEAELRRALAFPSWSLGTRGSGNEESEERKKRRRLQIAAPCEENSNGRAVRLSNHTG